LIPSLLIIPSSHQTIITLSFLITLCFIALLLIPMIRTFAYIPPPRRFTVVQGAGAKRSLAALTAFLFTARGLPDKAAYVEKELSPAGKFAKVSAFIFIGMRRKANPEKVRPSSPLRLPLPPQRPRIFAPSSLVHPTSSLSPDSIFPCLLISSLHPHPRR
jgi:hypothetical protein